MDRAEMTVNELRDEFGDVIYAAIVTAVRNVRGWLSDDAFQELLRNALLVDVECHEDGSFALGIDFLPELIRAFVEEEPVQFVEPPLPTGSVLPPPWTVAIFRFIPRARRRNSVIQQYPSKTKLPRYVACVRQ
jgi:hypothetical protein